MIEAWDIETFMASAAALLDLHLSPQSQDGVAANLTLLLQRAADFTELDLDMHVDPASLLRL
jgi:hypothetical protein